MSRLKIQGERKALCIPLSLKPKHKLMLAELEKIHSMNKSKIVQRLIEEAYITKFPEAHKVSQLPLPEGRGLES